MTPRGALRAHAHARRSWQHKDGGWGGMPPMEPNMRKLGRRNIRSAPTRISYYISWGARPVRKIKESCLVYS
jgi:hypothetical protein